MTETNQKPAQPMWHIQPCETCGCDACDHPQPGDDASLITNRGNIEFLNELIARYNLGPTTAVGVIPNSDMVQIVLDRAAPLDRWLNVLDEPDMIAGKFDEADPLLRLHLRGSLPGWPAVCVTMPYREAEDAAHCAVIRERIEQQAPGDLIDALSALDAQVTR